MTIIEFEKFISKYEINLLKYDSINEYINDVKSIVSTTTPISKEYFARDYGELYINKVLAVAEAFWNQFVYSGLSLFKKGIANFLEKAQDSGSHNDWMNVYIYSLEYVRFADLSGDVDEAFISRSIKSYSLSKLSKSNAS